MLDGGNRRKGKWGWVGGWVGGWGGVGVEKTPWLVECVLKSSAAFGFVRAHAGRPREHAPRHPMIKARATWARHRQIEAVTAPDVDVFGGSLLLRCACVAFDLDRVCSSCMQSS